MLISPRNFLLIAGLAIFPSLTSADGPPVFVSDVAPLSDYFITDTGDDVNPEIAVGADGVLIAIWDSSDTLGETIGSDQDIVFSRSTDDGRTWSDPKALTADALEDTGTDRIARIAADNNGNWIVVWSSDNPSIGNSGTDTDIVFSRSIDNGVTWSNALPLIASVSDGVEDLQPIIKTNNNRWLVLWNSKRNISGSDSDSDILSVYSDNVGDTWSSPTVVNSMGYNDAGDDSVPDLSFDSGVALAVWLSNNDPSGNAQPEREIYSSTSTNMGQTWSTARLVNSNSELNNDNKFAVVTSDGAQNFVAVWNTTGAPSVGRGDVPDDDLLFSVSNNRGINWSAAKRLLPAMESDSGHDTRPEIVFYDNVWYTIWQSENRFFGDIGNGDVDIYISSSVDTESWSSPILLNSNGTSDINTDTRPISTVNSRGEIVTVWNTANNEILPFGQDSDVLFSIAATEFPEPTTPVLSPVLSIRIKEASGGTFHDSEILYRYQWSVDSSDTLIIDGPKSSLTSTISDATPGVTINTGDTWTIRVFPIGNGDVEGSPAIAQFYIKNDGEIKFTGWLLD